ncbi:MAG: glycoside hydrolase/phage tail family protein, partial [Hydrogenophilaceae bacterium]|nr:glycoside hydrolase/phage tail family protein [Hydrogenophilaceae bacterium]
MAELILTSAARALGAAVLPAALRTVGTALLHAGASLIGRSVDDALFGATRRLAGPRLTELHVQGSNEGASIPRLYGRMRIAGQVIWAARFKEHESTQTSGGKGGPRVKTTTYSYSLSFAVGLCEGPIARIGRVWANGERLDLSAVNWRLYTGDEAQLPDPLIEAIEGGDNAPAYRGLAYVVFEDLPLEAFGNVIPQLSFEVVRPAPSPNADRLEDLARGVCLIPGAGEFVYATGPVRRVLGRGAEAGENAHAEADRADFEVAIDQLQAELPNVENILLVVSWFGTDLRCNACAIRPGVDSAVKLTKPQAWRVNGVTRSAAYLVSEANGAPAYGGTPSDKSVIAAIQSLKARGYKVGLYPFILMDVPGDNALPDPYGDAAQAAYPWRGRITLHPAAGQPGTPDKTAAAASQISAFVGTASAAHFGADADGVTYSGPGEWSFRRFVLHHAKLAQAAGGVDFFILGSELRGLTTARSATSTYPFVAALKTLAGDVRAVLGAGTKLTYAADWSEYFGHQPTDGSGDVHFHLDPLWADANIDCVGIDWYAPLTDWRHGTSHLDAQGARDIYDEAYLAGRIEAGENYDWHYASDADRAAQIRTPITDGAYSKPWVFRAKDVRAWWSNAHHDRPGGVESATPTAWVPQSKPVWFTELGCPAVDKGGNAPNLFIDPKSSESKLPPFSSGARDDLIQRRVIEAYLRCWDGDVVDPDGIFLWCWDARPYPDFPARDDVWADAPSWRLGHWLTGRAGLSDLSAVVSDLCAGADADVSGLAGAVAGFVVDSPASAREALAPLMAAFDFNAVEHEGALLFHHREAEAALTLTRAERVESGEADVVREDSAETPIEARVRFIDPQAEYRVAQVSARRRDAAEGGVVSLDAPLVLDEAQAERLAKR